MHVIRSLILGGILMVSALAPALVPGTAAAATKVQRVVSPGGIEAWLVNEPSLPIVAMRFSFHGGASHDPADRIGLSNMVSGLLDEGAGDMDSLAFQTRIDELAVEMGFDADRDAFSGRLKTLRENLEPAFEMLATALTEPRFDPEPVERIRGQILSSLARDAKDPNSIARRLWAAAMYPDHPYGWPSDGTPEGVAAVTADDLHRYMRERVAQSNLTVGVAGDITAEELAPLLDETFGGLSGTAVLETVPEVEPKAAGQVVIEPIAIPQSVVAFGQAGMKRSDPDYYAAYIVNEILGGGGFGSRLTEEVREKRGLAYGIYTYLLPLDHSALLAGGVATQNARVAETIRIVREELERMRAEGPTETELELTETETALLDGSVRPGGSEAILTTDEEEGRRRQLVLASATGLLLVVVAGHLRRYLSVGSRR